MNSSGNARISSCRWEVEGPLTIYRVDELKRESLQKLAEHEELEIDLHNVTELDTAGLQVLMALKREALLRQKSVRLVDHSQPVLDVLELLNLTGYFGDPILLSGEKAGKAGGGR